VRTGVNFTQGEMRRFYVNTGDFLTLQSNYRPFSRNTLHRGARVSVVQTATYLSFRNLHMAGHSFQITRSPSDSLPNCEYHSPSVACGFGPVAMGFSVC